jgi:excisionase family DNA binding protein
VTYHFGKSHSFPVSPAHEGLVAEFLSASGDDGHGQFMDTQQAADAVGVSRRTVRLWIDRGSIEAIRAGKRLWIYAPSLTRYLEELDALG